MAEAQRGRVQAALWARAQGAPRHRTASERALDRCASSRELECSGASRSASAARPHFVRGAFTPAPPAPRAASARPALIFNPHQQFERLRADGRYYQMQSIIREREIARHGSINPMLSDFGSGREAARYSGRHVGEDGHVRYA